jgi:predicted helicase
MASFRQILSTSSDDQNARGDQFEILCKWILQTDPIYTNKPKKVWMWDDWPGRWGPGAGIDLIAEDKEGKVWAVQVKCYDDDNSVSKKDIDSFLYGHI